MIFHEQLPSRIVHFPLNFLDLDLTTWKLTSIFMLYLFNAVRKPSLLENSLPTSESPKSNNALSWPDLQYGSSANSNASSVERSTLCMWVDDEYIANCGYSSSSFSPLSLSSGSVGICSG
ncbi:hypothetical protein J1N35_038378 [Gossypium stocksii]|uniref:Uncharacterized protein n=1 Tax=Gossypium stocksii TaxID=47602 RepID=A0A9D3UNR3_9ROSI|nr:hypothetical protein J1N35_038378 [Gossypium stocksii]